MTVALAVSGNLGVGKSTIADYLSRVLEVPLVSSEVYEPTYIADQHSDPRRWSFEAQLSFFARKAAAIREARADVVVVDRSLEEERQVFAQYWREAGQFDERAHATYLEATSLVPGPDATLVVAVHAPPEVAQERRRGRGRPSDTNLELDAFRSLDRLFQEWWSGLDGAQMVHFDSTKYDVRNRRGQAALLDALEGLRAGERHQPRLFSQLRRDDLLGEMIANARHRSVKLAHPRVYVAAPFSGLDVASPSTDNRMRLFDVGAPHGVLVESYIDRLRQISRRVSEAGFRVFLPHRDINDWGRKLLTSEQVASAVTREVLASDRFLGIVGSSFGAHLELGVALGAGLRVSLVTLEDTPASFVVEGLAGAPSIRTLAVPNLDHLPGVLSPATARWLLGH